jgi:hypothetical protein
MPVTCGVPQGSVLGPLLWNLLYDGILNIDMPEGVETMAFADDLAVVTTAKTENQLMRNTNEALHKIAEWLAKNKLQIAAEKTEAVMLSGRNRYGEIQFKAGEAIIKPKNCVKYLGVVMDKNLTFGHHITNTAGKAQKAAMSLSVPR